ncbi:MAG TPA: sigma-70 family RNA polymerase sigma factor [Verrucomicrobiae bacterium]|jgi:RNA polymerase sigma factor (sigma-70 family)
MMTTSMIPVAAQDDSELVGETLSGNRDAFSQIVSRYQSLICSLTYSATGSLGQSEDLAQETFITAWKHLRQLRERHKLRAWLCGIARNRINNFLRREGREPVHRADSLEEVSETHSAGPLPVDHVISKEEESILWRALERVPEIYREPLVLFYREHKSIETVAAQLDLTGDNVKQRLSRGRKLLQEQVAAFVEGALERTNPGKVFTQDVMSALPALAASSKMATIGAVAAKGGVAAKAGMMGWLVGCLSPLLVIFGGYSNYRMAMDEARTDEERSHVKSVFLNSLFITVAILLVLSGPLFWVCRGDRGLFLELLANATIAIYFLTILVLALASLPARRRYLAGTLKRDHGGNFPPSAYEYRSRLSLFGLPLLHVRIGDRFDVLRGPVKAWIAIGSSHAVGLIFASGGIAVAPISFGGIAIGLFSFGALSFGVISMGAIALGVLAYGGMAFGVQVACACGMALDSAEGACVIARNFAMGDIAHAIQANTDAAKQFFQENLFFRIARTISRFGFLVMLVWVIPVAVQARIAARARQQREKAASSGQT